MQHTLNVNFSFPQLVDVIKNLSPKEKLQISDALWEGDIDIPDEHQALVLERIKNARKNPARLLDWDKASKNLRK